MFPGVRSNLAPEEQEKAILEAARDEFENHGVRRANIDDIARRAAVSRSTLYRRFPSKIALLTAVTEVQFRKSNRRIESATSGLGPRQAVIEAFCAAAAELDDSALFRRLLSENVSRTIGVGVAEQLEIALIAELSHRIAKVLRRAGSEMPKDELLPVSELLIRTMFSYAKLPSKFLKLSDPVATRHFAEKFLAPLVR